MNPVTRYNTYMAKYAKRLAKAPVTNDGKDIKVGMYVYFLTDEREIGKYKVRSINNFDINQRPSGWDVNLEDYYYQSFPPFRLYASEAKVIQKAIEVNEEHSQLFRNRLSEINAQIRKLKTKLSKLTPRKSKSRKKK